MSEFGLLYQGPHIWYYRTFDSTYTAQRVDASLWEVWHIRPMVSYPLIIGDGELDHYLVDVLELPLKGWRSE